MWVLKIETTYEKTRVAALARKYQLHMSGYPLKMFKKNGKPFLQAAGFVKGEPKNISKLRKHKYFRKSYINRGFMIAEIELQGITPELYSPEIIFIRPIIYTPEGVEVVEVASFSKKPLMNLIKSYKKHLNTKILKLKKEEIKRISITSTQPELTEKQRSALDLAIKRGYYEFPKKTTIALLAKEMNISFSTYRAHLSKAESKYLKETFSRNMP